MKCPNNKVVDHDDQENNIVILVPYPAQGHVTPMLNLAAALPAHGLSPLVLTPDHIHRRIALPGAGGGVAFASMPCGGGGDFFAVEAAMEGEMPGHLERLVGGLADRVACVVVDLVASWAIDVARRCRVPVVGFWPAMLATYRLIAAVPDMVRSGLISETGTPKHQGTARFLPNQPALSTEELPWLIGPPAARRARFKFWTRALARSRTLRCVLINTFPNEPLPGPSPGPGPTLLPLGCLTKPPAKTGPTLWDEDDTCLQWLDRQKPGSVIYISFGSWVCPIGESKIRSLASVLDSLGLHFVWVLGGSWRAGLPEGFAEKVRNRGKIVSWAPQTEVLRHDSVGLYLTHCGWNSTLEAVLCQKRMLCYPIAGDQFLNCSYIVDVWKIGVRILGFGRSEVEEGLRRVRKDKGMDERLRDVREMVVGDQAVFLAKSNLGKFKDFLGKQAGLEEEDKENNVPVKIK